MGSHRKQRQLGAQRGIVDSTLRRRHGTPIKIPSVAPNVRRNPVSSTKSGDAASRQVADSASVLSGELR